jgi:hypothetical protein
MRTVTSVASLASAAAIVGPSIALGDSSEGCTFPELAARLAAIRSRYWKETAIADAQSDQFEALVEAATGIAWEDAPHYDDETPKAKRYWRIRTTLAKANGRGDGDSVSKMWDEVLDEIHLVYVQILQQKPRTFADFGVIGQAVALNYVECWTCGEHPDLRKLIEHICGYADVEPLPGYIKPRPDWHATLA